MWNIVLLLFLFAATQIVAALLAFLWSSRHVLLAGDSSHTAVVSSGVSAQVICSLLCYGVLLALLLALRLVRRNPFRRLSVVPSTSPLLPLGAFVLFSIGANFLLSPFSLDDDGTLQLFLRMSQHPEGWLLLCVVGPVIEEYVFREGIQRHLMMMNLRVWSSVVISAVLFAVVHTNFAQMLPAFALGAALGVFYARTGNLRLCTIAHILNNTLAVSLLLLHNVSERMTLSPAWSLVVGCFATILGVLGLWCWWKKTQPRL